MIDLTQTNVKLETIITSMYVCFVGDTDPYLTDFTQSMIIAYSLKYPDMKIDHLEIKSAEDLNQE